MLGAAFSLTDLIVAAAVWYGTQLGVTIDRHEHVKAWLDRCCARPAFRAIGV